MKNRKLILIVSFVLAMTMSLGGTLAYLTDTDADVNTMVLGNVKITQNEQQRVEIGNAAAGLESFEDGQMMLPGVYDLVDAEGNKIANPAREEVDVNGYKITYGGGMRTFPNYMDKIVTVTNNGNSSAYVRTLIAVPAAPNEDDADNNVSENWLHYNAVSDTDTVPANGWYYGKSVEAGEYPENYEDHYIVPNVEIDGAIYDVTVVTNVVPVKPGETTGPNLVGLYLDNNVDYKDGKYYAKDSKTGELVKVWNKSELKVLVLSQAVQADGFENAFAAFKNSFGDVDKTVAETWFNGELSIETPGIVWPNNNPPEIGGVIAENKADLQAEVKAQVAAGNTDIVINANGKEIDAHYCITTAMVPEDTTLTIKGANFTGSGYGNAVNGTVVFEDCTFNNVAGAYSIHFDSGKGHVVFNDCTLEGWCSFGSAIKSVTMNNCTLKGNGIYAMYRFYPSATLNNCVIDCSNSNLTDKYPEGISAVSGSVAELNNCTLKYCDYEVQKGKIVVDNVAVAESTGEYLLIKNADR